MNDTFGLLATFETPELLLAAAIETKQAGYKTIDAFSPYPVHGLDKAIGVKKTRLPLVVLVSGIVGGVTGFLFQSYVSAVGYPLNVGGRPLISAPSFIPVTFELTILFAGIAAVVGMLVANGLPEPYHPVFNAPQFDRATRDRFYLLVESRDPQFDVAGTKRFLERLCALEVTVVEP